MHSLHIYEQGFTFNYLNGKLDCSAMLLKGLPKVVVE